MKSIFSSRQNKIPHNNEGKEKTETPFFSKEGKVPFFNSVNSGVVQTKLTIGQPNDKYEKEADNMADAVVNNVSKPDVQHKEISNIQRESLATPLEDEKLGTAEQRMEEDKLVQEKPEGEMINMQESDEEEDFRPYDLPTKSVGKEVYENFFPPPPNPDRIEEKVRKENKGKSEDEINRIFLDTLEKKDLDFTIKVKSTQLVFETFNEILATFSVVPEPIIRVLAGLSHDQDSDVLIQELEKLADDPVALSEMIPGPGGKIAKIGKLRRFINKLKKLQYSIRNRTKRALKRNKKLRAIRKRKRAITPIIGMPELPEAKVKKLPGKKLKQLSPPKDPKPKKDE